MNLLLNNKSFDKFISADLETILNNEDFKESDFIDYKENFAFFELSDKKIRAEKTVEFKHDICAFANSQGGYIFFGIREEKGIPIELKGIIIEDNNTDKFELDLKNKMFGILPAIPQTKIKFIKLDNTKYVVVLLVVAGGLTPYVFKENENDFKFWNRRGNGKFSMSYNEVRRLYNQALSLSDEIESFRNSRENACFKEFKDVSINGVESGVFLLFHIIPANFFNIENHQKIFLMMRDKKINFSQSFPSFCNGRWYPNVDGVSFPGEEYSDGSSANFFNNGISELLVDLSKFVYNSKECGEILPIKDVIAIIKTFFNNYCAVNNVLCNDNRQFLCASIIGCKNIVSSYDLFRGITSKIDRNNIRCSPIELLDITDENQSKDSINNLIIEIVLSLGIKNIDNYIAESD